MRTAVVALLIGIAPTSACAWGQEGHAIIAEIAQHKLTREAAESIVKLLRVRPDAPDYATPSLASLASWADDVRSTTKKESEPWHYIDAPLKDAIDMNRDCPPKGCVVDALDKQRKILLCASSDEAKRDALRFIVHFVGDVHQPLHTVDDALGGNQVYVHVLISGKICDNRTCYVQHEWQNLHEVWDSTIIQKTFYNWGAYVEYLENSWLKTHEALAQDGGTPLDWAKEAHALAKDFWVADGATLDQGYYRRALPVVDKQLGRAGIRLARFLNDAYASRQCPAP